MASRISATCKPRAPNANANAKQRAASGRRAGTSPPRWPLRRRIGRFRSILGVVVLQHPHRRLLRIRHVQLRDALRGFTIAPLQRHGKLVDFAQTMREALRMHQRSGAQQIDPRIQAVQDLLDD